MDPRSQHIRAIDDHLRKNPTADVAIMTPGIAALGQEAADRIVKTITVFDDFCRVHDPHDDHDAGSFDAEGHTILFKIDHYERPPDSPSPEPTGHTDRVRVITVMLAEEDRTRRIRELNDQFRKGLPTGMALMSPSVSGLGEEAVARIMERVATFDDFGDANDPHGEHDLGAFEAEGRTIVFKIDCYDTDLKHQSPDPTDPAVTVRVMTVMLAGEY